MKLSFLKKYPSLPNYLLRFTLFQVGPVHVRLHTILTPDGTPYLHNHPFHYISIILSGGYVEQLLYEDTILVKQHKRFSVIVRNDSDFHRISSLKNTTKTLFMTFETGRPWKLFKHKNLVLPENFHIPTKPGVYKRTINDSLVYARFNEFWYKGRATIEEAKVETKLSIHQIGNFVEV